jgi:hypothetical protein
VGDSVLGVSDESAIAAEVEKVGNRYAQELVGVVDRTRLAIAESKATTADRARVLAHLVERVRNGGLALSWSDPASHKIAKLAGARRLASEVYFRTQQDLLESGKIGKVESVAPQTAASIYASYGALNLVIREALSEETTWGEVPGLVASKAMEEAWGGVLRSLMDLLAQLLSILQKIGEAALNLVAAADKAAGILKTLSKYAVPILIVVAIVWAGPGLSKLRPS